MNNDKLYRSGKVTEDFTFNDKVAEVFDDMLDRSVPHYHTVITATAAMIRRLAKPESVIYDLAVPRVLPCWNSHACCRICICVLSAWIMPQLC